MKTSLGLAALIFGSCVGYRTPMDSTQPTPPKNGGVVLRDAGNDIAPDAVTDTRTKVQPDVADDVRPDLVPDARPDVRADTAPDSGPDSAPDVRADLAADARPDLGPDIRPDGATDIRPDVAADLRPDVAPDSRPDVGPDVRPDGPADTRPDSAPDAGPLSFCSSSGQKFVLLLGDDGQMYQFDSGTLATRSLATVACGIGSLNSMTVSSIGPAYISNSVGDLCKVDLRTFKSSLTTFNPVLVGSTSYGMALLPDTSAAGQTLYIAVNGNTPNVNHLERINLTSYVLTNIGDITPAVPWAELTAGPNAELYGFAVGATESLLLNIDPNTASAIDVTHVPAGYSAAAFALVYWQSGFYLFLSDQFSGSTVYFYRKGDSAVATLGALKANIIGAGVAACP